MDANIKTPQDALEWLECRIHEEAEADGEMTNEHAIQLAFIQNMLAKFPRRHCDTMSESACAVYFDALYNGNRDGVCMATTEREKNIHRYYCKYIDWLFANAKAKGDTK